MNDIRKTLLIVANVDWFFISHRLVIAEEAVKQGWKVFVACEDTGRSHEISSKGISFVNLSFSRSGTNPVEELQTIADFYKLYKRIKPDVVHQVTLKPVIYGSIVAKLLKIPKIVNAISGLGYNFTGEKKSVVQKILLKLMKYGFNRDNMSIIFQNDDDKNELLKLGVIAQNNHLVKIKGSGVDLEQFNQSEFPDFDLIKILFPARMLWDKGVKELLEASTLLKNKYQGKIQFILSGLADKDNKAGVSEEYLNTWCDGEYVKWIGYQKEMVAVYRDSHIVVLPSYREGMPKTLLEACAIGRPIITTDAIGCRECVDEGENGYKVPVYSVQELADAIEKLSTNKEEIIRMGANSRKKSEKEFDVKEVIKKHIKLYER